MRGQLGERLAQNQRPHRQNAHQCPDDGHPEREQRREFDYGNSGPGDDAVIPYGRPALKVLECEAG